MSKLKGQVTPEQIQNWIKEVKEKYGATAKVHSYEVDGRIGYLRSVDRDTYSLAVSKVSSNPAKFNEVVIESIWLGGDDEIKKDDQLYFGLIDFVEDFMGKKKGILKSL